MRVNKHYRLPKSLVDRFATLPVNRSAAMSMAVMTAAAQPDILVKALQTRVRVLPLQAATEESVKVSLTLDERVVEALDNLRILTRLPIEHVLRLAMEAYLT